ncbi:hypothetical protein BGX26_007484, partial [Mortierella sp. AD094]
VSIEGSVIVERKDANEAFYRQKVTAAELLSGSVTPPPQADILYRALNSRASNGNYSIHRSASSAHGGSDTDIDSPGVGRSASIGAGRYGGYNATQAGVARSASNAGTYTTSHDEKAQLHEEEQLPRYTPSVTSGARKAVGGRVSTDNSGHPGAINHNIANQTGPRVPPRIGAKPDVVTALYDFAGEQATDLSFKKGDVITVVKKTDSRNDWWTGKCNGREGSFPANYT